MTFVILDTLMIINIYIYISIAPCIPDSETPKKNRIIEYTYIDQARSDPWRHTHNELSHAAGCEHLDTAEHTATTTKLTHWQENIVASIGTQREITDLDTKLPYVDKTKLY